MKNFVVTRPNLAINLQVEGFYSQPIRSPWDPARIAWSFPASRKLLEAIRDAYANDIGKPCPDAVLYELERREAADE